MSITIDRLINGIDHRINHDDVPPPGVKVYHLTPNTPIHEVRRLLNHEVCIYETVLWRSYTILRLPFHRYRLTVSTLNVLTGSTPHATTRMISGIDAARALRKLLDELDKELRDVTPPVEQGTSIQDAAHNPVKRPRQGHGYRGITKEGNRWRANVYLGRVDGRRREVYLGFYVTPEQAARAYDRYLVEQGIDKPLNFPQEWGR